MPVLQIAAGEQDKCASCHVMSISFWKHEVRRLLPAASKTGKNTYTEILTQKYAATLKFTFTSTPA